MAPSPKRRRWAILAAVASAASLAVGCAGPSPPPGTNVDMGGWVIAVPEGGWHVETRKTDDLVMFWMGSPYKGDLGTRILVYRRPRTGVGDPRSPERAARAFLDEEEYVIRTGAHRVDDLQRGTVTIAGRRLETLTYQLSWRPLEDRPTRVERGTLHVYVPADVSTARELYGFLVCRTIKLGPGLERVDDPSRLDLPPLDPVIRGFRIRREPSGP